MGNVYTFPIPRLPFSYVSLRKLSSTGEQLGSRDLYPPLMEQEAYEQAKSPLWRVVLDVGREIMETRTNSRDELLQKTNEQFQGLGHKYIENLLEYFNTIDVNEDGLIDYRELCQALNTMGDNSSEDKRKTLFREADIDHSGAIDFMEFVQLIHRLSEERGEREGGKMRQLFRAIAEISADVTDLQRISYLSPETRFQCGLY